MAARARRPSGMRPVVDAERCKGCGLCVHFCPAKVLVFGRGINRRGLDFVVGDEARLAECTGCAVCVLMCPDTAVEILAAGGAGKARQ